MDFPADYVYTTYPDNVPGLSPCGLATTLNHRYCGSVLVLGQVFCDNAIVVDPSLPPLVQQEDCSCCQTRWHRIQGALVVTGTITVGVPATVTAAPVPTCCPGTLVRVNGNLILTNTLHVVGDVLPLPTCPS